MGNHWVLQNNLFFENNRKEIIDVFEKLDIKYTFVEIVPFSHELIPEIYNDTNIITNGSILLSKIAKERDWNPGGFLNNNFNYEVWFPYFQKYLLNKNAIFTDVKDAFPEYADIFVRPILDDKSFDGIVFNNKEFYDWKEEILLGKNNFVTPETKILYDKAKNIGQEHRHFIVDKKVITSSRYKLGGFLNQSENVDQYIIDFAENMSKIYSPARAFVLDTYINEDEIGIVELGCICNAGFYKADVQKIIMALEFMDI